jgi:hypothetical protein
VTPLFARLLCKVINFHEEKKLGKTTRKGESAGDFDDVAEPLFSL